MLLIVPRRIFSGGSFLFYVLVFKVLVLFARYVMQSLGGFNARNGCLAAGLLQRGYRYHKLRKTFSKFYRRHYELISKFNVGLLQVLQDPFTRPFYVRAFRNQNSVMAWFAGLGGLKERMIFLFG